MNEGRKPAPTRTRARSDEVVVFPWVPLTATVRRSPQMAARIRGPGQHRHRAGAGRPTTSGLSAGTAVEMATKSIARSIGRRPTEVGRVVADEDLHAEAGQAVEPAGRA